MTEKISLFIKPDKFSRMSFRFFEKDEPVFIDLDEISIDILLLENTSICNLLIYNNPISIEKEIYDLIASAFRSNKIISLSGCINKSSSDDDIYLQIIIFLSDENKDDNF